MTTKRIIIFGVALILVSILGAFLFHSNEWNENTERQEAKRSKKQPSPSPRPIQLADTTVKVAAKPPTPMLKPKTVSMGIHGRVMDSETLEKITNATLEIRDVSKARVDQLGRFSISAPVRKEKWAVIVKAKGYHPKLFEAHATRGLQTIHNIELKKAKLGRLEGEVEFLGKLPDGYTIFLNREKYHFPISQTHFVIDDLIIGQYLVGISGVDEARNFPLIDISVFIREDEPARIKFTVPAQIKFSGRIVDEDGNGLEGAYMNVAKLLIMSEKDGRFNSAIIPAALYQKVKISHHQYGWSEFGPFDFRDKGREDLEFVLRPKGHGRVQGTIKKLLMKGQERGLVQLYKLTLPKDGQAGTTKIQRSFTLKEHPLKYDFPNLLPGQYIVQVVGPKQRFQTKFELTENQQLQLDLMAPDLPKKTPK